MANPGGNPLPSPFLPVGAISCHTQSRNPEGVSPMGLFMMNSHIRRKTEFELCFRASYLEPSIKSKTSSNAEAKPASADLL